MCAGRSPGNAECMDLGTTGSSTRWGRPSTSVRSQRWVWWWQWWWCRWRGGGDDDGDDRFVAGRLSGHPQHACSGSSSGTHSYGNRAPWGSCEPKPRFPNATLSGGARRVPACGSTGWTVPSGASHATGRYRRRRVSLVGVPCIAMACQTLPCLPLPALWPQQLPIASGASDPVRRGGGHRPAPAGEAGSSRLRRRLSLSPGPGQLLPFPVLMPPEPIKHRPGLPSMLVVLDGCPKSSPPWRSQAQ